MFRKFKAFEASVRYEFKDPDTGYFYRAGSLRDLYQQIIKYRSQNQLEPLDHLNLVVENYLCGLPENVNKCTVRELNRSIWQTVKGGIQILKNLAYKVYATQAVAEKRSKQCEGCKFNVFPDKDWKTQFGDNIAIMQVGERKTANADKLGSCEVCTCVLRSKVFFAGKLDPFTEEEVVKLKEVDCWQLKLSGQDK